MEKFIPRGKLGKKTKRRLDRQRRFTWLFSQVTRTMESKKTYDRHKKSHNL